MCKCFRQHLVDTNAHNDFTSPPKGLRGRRSHGSDQTMLGRLPFFICGLFCRDSLLFLLVGAAGLGLFL